MKRLDIDTELVIDMYVNQGMSLKKIGEIFDVSYHPIKDRLKEKNITIKPSHQASREILEKQVDIEKMVDMYVNQKTYSKVYNVACGESITLDELVTSINKIYKKNIPPKYGDMREGDVLQSLASLEKIYKELNYSPLVKFNEGLKKTIEWYEKNNN